MLLAFPPHVLARDGFDMVDAGIMHAIDIGKARHWGQVDKRGIFFLSFDEMYEINPLLNIATAEIIERLENMHEMNWVVLKEVYQDGVKVGMGEKWDSLYFIDYGDEDDEYEEDFADDDEIIYHTKIKYLVDEEDEDGEE